MFNCLIMILIHVILIMMDLGFVNFCKLMMLNMLGSLVNNSMMISERELM